MAILIIFLLACQVFSIRRGKRETNDDPYRLPETIIPEHYDIHLTLKNTTFTKESNTFSGTVSINISVYGKTSNIKLHSSYEDLYLESITLDGVEIEEEYFIVNNTTNILTIYGQTITYYSSHVLKIRFIGQLATSEDIGFFKSSYVNDQGVTKYVVATQFQSIHTRRAFPCWDEPGFKSTFQITIHHPIELTALSNTPGNVIEIDEIENLATTEFETTPLMSSYLVAFVISDLTCSSGVTIGTTSYRLCSRRETVVSRDWALLIGPRILAAYNEYTDFDYSLGMKKVDEVAVPGKTGAMENWGLLLYSENKLLWNPEKSTNNAKQSTALVLSHEMAHQWFGNLVTCKWWSVTFLNEGLAQFYQYHILDTILPDWELKKQFVITTIFSAFSFDSSLTSLPMQSEVSTPSEISAKFRSITYRKGASVFRMLEHSMGYENFRNGIRMYLRVYQFGSVMPADLWNILKRHVNDTHTHLPADLNTVMQNWVENSGYPLLTVTISGRKIFISQERFLVDGRDTTSKWYVPVTYTTSDNVSKFEITTPDRWLTPTTNLTISLSKNAQWIILNNQHAGYYRVNYDSTLWGYISTALLGTNFSGIPELNRVQIVNDLFALIIANKMTYTRVFTILEFLEYDDSYIVWYPVDTELDMIFKKISLHSDLGLRVKAHILRLSSRLYDSVHIANIDEDNQIYTLRQVLAVTLACRLGNERCVEGVRQHFNNYRINGTLPPKNLRDVIYCNGIRHSNDKSDWEFLYSASISTNVSSLRNMLLSALGCSNDEDILIDYLNRSITKGSGVDSYTSTVFSTVYVNHIGVDIAFNFLVENQVAIYNHLQSWYGVGSILKRIAGQFTSHDQLEELRTTYTSGGFNSSLSSDANNSIGIVKSNLQWIEKYQSDFYQYYKIEEIIIPTTTTERGGAAALSSSFLLILILILFNKMLLK